MCDHVNVPMPGSAVTGVSAAALSDTIVPFHAKRGEMVFVAVQGTVKLNLSLKADGSDPWFTMPMTVAFGKPQGFHLSENLAAINLIFTGATQTYTIWRGSDVPPLRDVGTLDRLECLLEAFELRK